MPRTFTAAQRNAVAGALLNCYGKLEVTDADGVWKDVGALGAGDWFNSATLSDSIDAETLSFQAVLLRDSGNLSLSPYRSDSTLNRNAGGAYAPLLDTHRRWRISAAVLPAGVAPVPADYKEMGTGIIDVIDIQDKTATITITGRGLEADLLDAFIPRKRLYGSPGGTAMETVLQQMLDDQLGAGAVSLYTPVSPAFAMRQWAQEIGNLKGALSAVADRAGFVVRYRYDAADVNRCTLYKPNRTATVADWTLGPTEYLALPSVKADLSGVRNYVELTYVDAVTGKQSVIAPAAQPGTVSCTAGAATFSQSQAGVLANGAIIVVAGVPYTVSAFNGTTGCTLSGNPTFAASPWRTSASITRFGLRYMAVDVSGDTQLTSSAQAQAMADAIRSDIEFPNVEQLVETYGFWVVQLYDYGTLVANGVHYDTDQSGGVTGYAHVWANGTLRTTVALRGKPAGHYRTWLTLGTAAETKPATPPAPAPSIPSLTIVSTDSDEVTTTLHLDCVPGTTPLAALSYTLTRKTGRSAPVTVDSGAGSLLPKDVPVTRHPRMAPIYTLTITDPVHTAQIRTLTLSAIGRDGTYGSGHAIDKGVEDDTRAGYGGIPVPRGRIHTDTVYDRTGMRPLIDPDLLQSTTDLSAPDGLGAPESKYMGSRRSTRQAGHAQSRVDEDDRRAGYGGIPVPKGRIHTDPIYDRSGMKPLIDPDLLQLTVDLNAADGLGTPDSVFMSRRRAIRGAGHAQARVDEDDRRSGTSGLPVRGQRFVTDPYYTADGATNLLDPVTGRIGGTLAYPGGVALDALRPQEAGANVTETRTALNTANVDTQPAATVRRGAVKGDTAIDVGNVVVAGSIDLARAYTGKHLGNVPDDAPSDRRASTLNQKTGGDRGYLALDLTNKLQTGVTSGATAADGEAGIESWRGSTRRGARQSGHAVDRVAEDDVRSGMAGVPTPRGRTETAALMDSTNAAALVDTALKQFTTALLRPSDSAPLSDVVQQLRGLDGHAASTMRYVDGGQQRNLARGVQRFIRKDGEAIAFSPAFVTAPSIEVTEIMILSRQPVATAWTPAAPVYSDTLPTARDLGVSGLTATGCTVRARLRQSGALTARTAQFPVGNNLTAAPSSTFSDALGFAPSANDQYTARFQVTLTVVAAPGRTKSIQVTVMVLRRAGGSTGAETTLTTVVYTHTDDGLGPPPLVIQEVFNLVFAGMGTTDVLEIRIPAGGIVITGTGGSASVSVKGKNPTDFPGENGVDYSTTAGDITTSATPDANHAVLVIATGWQP